MLQRLISGIPEKSMSAPRLQPDFISKPRRTIQILSTLLAHGADARYVSTGHLVFVRSGTLVAAPFDTRRLKLTGNAVTVLSDVMQAVNTPGAVIESGDPASFS